MLNQKNKIHLALAFDQNFLTPFYVLLTSIFRNNPENIMVFHTIAAGVDQAEKDRINKFVQQHAGEIFFYEVDKKLIEKFVVPEFGHISAATFYRFYFPELVPAQLKKLLFIDTDIIVLGDLAELYNTDISAVPAAAVVDQRIPERPDLGINSNNLYFNAGVILMNLPLWNSQQISEKAIAYLGKYPNIKLADQDALNAVLVNNWLILDNKFNVTFYDIPEFLPKKEFDNFLKGKVIIHYTTKNKPWKISCTNRFRYLYQHYFKLSPHANKKKYTDLKLNKSLLISLFRMRTKEFLIDNTPVFKLLGKKQTGRK